MSHRWIFAIVILAASCLPAVCQTAAPNMVLTGVGCPVAYSASREGTLLARARTPDQGVRPGPAAAPLVNVHFDSASVARILQVHGSVYGTTAAPHVQLVVGDSAETSGPQARTQNFHLTGFNADASTLDWKLAVRDVPVIQGIRLTEIRLADGTVWQESASSQCRIQLSGFLQVSAGSSPLR